MEDYYDKVARLRKTLIYRFPPYKTAEFGRIRCSIHGNFFGGLEALIFAEKQFNLCMYDTVSLLA